ncbi:uncharacterized protein Z520_06312 [Fonsecaea multimorphosa CBS 102226]|uniref:Uncharacterized protein n=1 Tax=Fonsecaea multimorphosa CBS 102226 TaxID=1442371 RepID=A0A0D2JXE7_9EURO|nr:uncharacterized protein Z520_06312 [Fonsecaea multimorphosa CBS 102226]KIX98232.1 hypothetical protein Z520_06312 [Fonsecaea multimorphosa CBS 102226]
MVPIVPDPSRRLQEMKNEKLPLCGQALTEARSKNCVQDPTIAGLETASSRGGTGALERSTLNSEKWEAGRDGPRKDVAGPSAAAPQSDAAQMILVDEVNSSMRHIQAKWCRSSQSASSTPRQAKTGQQLCISISKP